MPHVHARLLGGLEFIDDEGGELKLATRKARALLAYLIVESDRWHTRERLAALLWSDRQQAQARHSLTQALGTIRKIAEHSRIELITTEADRVRLNASGMRSDVLEFRNEADTDPVRVAERYRGAFLDGFVAGDPAFEAWADLERAALDRLACSVFEAASIKRADRGDPDGAHGLASRWLALEPLSEAAHRQVMRILATSGDRTGAIRQFQACERLLREELAVGPSPETVALVAEIQAAKSDPAPEGRRERVGAVAMIGAATTCRAPKADIDNPVTTPDSIERQNLIDVTTEEGLPVIAVLPFANQSDEPDLVYLADGLADDVLFALAGFRWFKVLGRPSTFRLAGMGLTTDQLRTHLGATHLVTGTIRRQSGKLRILVELIDCTTAQQIWSARFEENLDRIFDVEDEVVSQIASAIVPALQHSEIQALLHKPPNSLSAYELLQRGNWHLYRNLSTYDADEQAMRCFEAALRLDPDYATALAAMAHVKFRAANTYIAGNFRESLADARQAAQQALALDPLEPRALRYLGAAESMLGDQEGALVALERAIELCPSFASAHSGLAFVYDFRGDFQAAKPAADETIRLRPHDPALHRCVIARSIADYGTGEYPQAERIARNSLRTSRDWWMSNALLAASLGQQGHSTEAKTVVEHICRTYPGLTLEKLLGGLPFAQSVHLEHLREGLGKAGWRDAGQALSKTTITAAPADTAAEPDNVACPSIAVLPFASLSADPEQAFFADGLADDIINTLSKISKLRVIARHSAFAFKDSGAAVRDIARDLHVRYVLEGSVRRAGQRLRVSAHLIDAQDDRQIWAERYDRYVSDVFDIQDEITKEIVTALRLRLTDGEEALTWSRGTTNVEAWENLVKAKELQDRLSATHLFEARRFAERAIELDPDYANAWAVLAGSYFREARLDFAGDRKQRLHEAERLVNRALSLDDTVPWAIGIGAMTASALGRHDMAERMARRAIHLQPGNAEIRAFSSFVFAFSCKFDEALEQGRIALSLNPFPPLWYRSALIRPHALLGEHGKALALVDEVLRAEPDHIPARIFQAYCHEASAQHENAGRAIKDLLRYVPHFRTQHVSGYLSMPDDGLVEDVTDKLRRAGLPDAEQHRSSIAVLPFKNLSADPEQDYFAEGIAEDVAERLVQVRTFVVFSGVVTSKYVGDALDARRIGSELGAEYVVEGSVRRSTAQIRVSARLISARSGAQLWAERFEGPPEDLFDLQDRITEVLVSTIEPELVRAEGERLIAARPDNMAAYDWVLKGLAYMHKLTPDDTRSALRCFEQAIATDRGYGRAHAFASWCYRRHVQQSGLTLSEPDRQRAIDLAHDALRLDRDDPYVLVYAGATIEWLEREFDEALALYERALELTPTSHRFWNAKASALSKIGRTHDAIAAAERAIELSHKEPAIWVSYWSIAEAHLQERRFEQAAHFARQALRHNDLVASAYHILAAASAHLGRRDQAKRAIERALEINPDLTLGNLGELYPIARMKNLDTFSDGLRRAGLAEAAPATDGTEADRRPSIAVLPKPVGRS